MATAKITEAIDHLQKKVSSLKYIYKLYPDCFIRSPYHGSSNESYYSASLNKDVDTVRFGFEKSWMVAYTSKTIGCIEVNSEPNKFNLFSYYPDDLFHQLIVQNYRETMTNYEISDKLIRDCDLKILSFIKERKINLSKSNLNDSNENIRKLLLLL